MTPDIKRILVPLDFSANSDRALVYARGLAQRYGATLHLVHVCEVPMIPAASSGRYAIAYSDWSQRLGEETEQQLTRIAAGVTGCRVTTEVLFGPAASAIVEAASTNDVDLIVMGTHGHRAALRVIMGAVAERVVRTAPCPVLTVRERRPLEVKNGRAARLAFAGLLFGALCLSPGTASAQEMKQTTPGGEVFRTYCASCHGTTARGDGPLASSMNRKPANLTEIAKRNGGQYPSELVFRTIDGRQPVRGHGGPDMPVWGDAFAKSREAGDTDRVKAVINSLVEYLESIQLRPPYDQQQP